MFCLLLQIYKIIRRNSIFLKIIKRRRFLLRFYLALSFFFPTFVSNKREKAKSSPRFFGGGDFEVFGGYFFLFPSQTIQNHIFASKNDYSKAFNRV